MSKVCPDRRGLGDEDTESIQGQLLRVSAKREVAIYLREGRIWIADFIDGDGALVEPATWFRFNCGSPRAGHARRRMLLESAIPLSVELAKRIERLHAPIEASHPIEKAEK